MTGSAAISPLDADETGSRTARLLGRVDLFLGSLASDRARHIFLDQQIEAWERRYSRFLASQGASETIADPTDAPQAADFLLTITGLERRRGALTHGMEGTQMLDPKRRPRIEHAIRALLVAADQRCPAIIGQVHVLYHTASVGPDTNAEQVLGQVKREAQDLLNAIAHTEAAMGLARSHP